MLSLLIAVVTQTLPFLPLSVAICISFKFLQATDMTLDGSFVLGAAIFARLITLGISPELAALVAVIMGGMAGIMVSLIQKGGRIDPLLAGVLASFILVSLNLMLMGRPNINLLNEPTLLTKAFASSDYAGWSLVAFLSFLGCFMSYVLIRSRLGLVLRALGDNANYLQRLGNKVELYRMIGFALTNALAAFSGLLTAQIVGYADVGMGFGVTLTGIGAIILGYQFMKILRYNRDESTISAYLACLLGVMVYFTIFNTLVRLDITPAYFKMILGISLVVFLRAAFHSSNLRQSL